MSVSGRIDFRFEKNSRFDSDLEDLVAKQLQRYAAFAERHAKSNVPVETGNLLRSGRSGVVGHGKEAFGYVAFTAPYAVFVELGTRYMAAQPYLRPALQALKGYR